MSYLETAFITRDEYNAHEDDRLHLHEIVVGELYVAMFSLTKNSFGYDGAKTPARIDEITEEEGDYLTSLTLFNHQMQEARRCSRVNIANGYWVNVKSCEVTIRLRGLVSESAMASEAYLVNDGDLDGGALDEISASEGLAASKPVLALATA